MRVRIRVEEVLTHSIEITMDDKSAKRLLKMDDLSDEFAEELGDIMQQHNPSYTIQDGYYQNGSIDALENNDD